MARNQFTLKTLILVTIVSYFAYSLYWFAKTIPWIVHISQGPEYYSAPTGLIYTNAYSLLTGYITDYSAFFGLAIRVIGASYALLAALLILKNKTNPKYKIRNKISKALLLEGLYFLSLIPAIYFLLGFSALIPEANIFLTLLIVTQISLISPFLILLSRKVKRYRSSVDAFSTLRLTALSCLSYVVALWGVYMFKWVGMIAEAYALGDPNWLRFGVRIFGLQNTLIVLSLSVVFAVVGTLQILRRGENITIKWWGLSLIFLSTHFVIYMFYVVAVGFWDAILYGEVWTIPLLGLGIYISLKNPKIQAPFHQNRTSASSCLSGK
jgi:hypothetical protein